MLSPSYTEHSLPTTRPGMPEPIIRGAPVAHSRTPGTTLGCLAGQKTWTVVDCRLDSRLDDLASTFIRDQYRIAHGAQLTELMPRRYALMETTGQLTGAVGLASFGAKKRLVEYYLDQPVESYLSERLGLELSRDDVMEVGNLAATSLTGAILLTAFLYEEVHRLGKSWAIFTGTSAVRLALRRIGIPNQVLTRAEARCLGQAQAHWGSYYDKDPQVILVNVEQGLRAVRQKYYVEEQY